MTLAEKVTAAKVALNRLMSHEGVEEHLADHMGEVPAWTTVSNVASRWSDALWNAVSLLDQMDSWSEDEPPNKPTWTNTLTGEEFYLRPNGVPDLNSPVK